MGFNEHWQGRNSEQIQNEFTKYGVFIFPKEFIEIRTLVKHCFCKRLIANVIKCLLCQMHSYKHFPVLLQKKLGIARSFFLLWVTCFLCKNLKFWTILWQKAGSTAVLLEREEFWCCSSQCKSLITSFKCQTSSNKNIFFWFMVVLNILLNILLLNICYEITYFMK